MGSAIECFENAGEGGILGPPLASTPASPHIYLPTHTLLPFRCRPPLRPACLLPQANLTLPPTLLAAQVPLSSLGTALPP